jgi:hypothetical protein
MVQGAEPCQLECRPGDLPRHIPIQGHDYIMAVIDTRIDRADAMQCPHHHLRMFVSREACSRRYHAVIKVAGIVEDGTTAGPPPNENGILAFRFIAGAVAIAIVLEFPQIGL